MSRQTHARGKATDMAHDHHPETFVVFAEPPEDRRKTRGVLTIGQDAQRAGLMVGFEGGQCLHEGCIKRDVSHAVDQREYGR